MDRRLADGSCQPKIEEKAWVAVRHAAGMHGANGAKAFATGSPPSWDTALSDHEACRVSIGSDLAGYPLEPPYGDYLTKTGLAARYRVAGVDSDGLSSRQLNSAFALGP